MVGPDLPVLLQPCHAGSKCRASAAEPGVQCLAKFVVVVGDFADQRTQRAAGGFALLMGGDRLIGPGAQVIGGGEVLQRSLLGFQGSFDLLDDHGQYEVRLVTEIVVELTFTGP